MFFAKVVVFATVAVAWAAAAPQFAPGYGPQFGPQAAYRGNYVPIVSQHYDLNPDQSYTFGYQSADGSARDEVGAPRVPGPEGPAIAVQGSFTYTSPEGPVQVNYVADENGYQPTGSNVHPAIVKAVAEQVAQARGAPYQPNPYNANPYQPNPYYG